MINIIIINNLYKKIINLLNKFKLYLIDLEDKYDNLNNLNNSLNIDINKINYNTILNNEEIYKNLNNNGYTIIDGFLGYNKSIELINEINYSNKNNLLKPNQIQYLNKSGKNLVKVTKPNIYECDLYDKNLREKLKNFNKFYNIDSDIIVNLIKNNKYTNNFENLIIGEKGRAIKLQLNNGGAFPYHYDNTGKPNKRKLTLIIYLNLNYKSIYGGQLELLPFLNNKPIIIKPLFDRLVIFKSDLMLHRVLPVNVNNNIKKFNRLCFSNWIDSLNINNDNDIKLNIPKKFLLKENKNLLINYFKNSPSQRVIARCVYNELFIKSIKDSMFINKNELNIMLEKHNEYVNSFLKNDILKNLINILRSYINLNEL